jgi:hypothetical protein
MRRPLTTNGDEFNTKIIELNYPHAVAITETWFDDKSLITSADYNHFNKNRGGNKKGELLLSTLEKMSEHMR